MNEITDIVKGFNVITEVTKYFELNYSSLYKIQK